MQNWLVTYYDGNENKVGLVLNVGADALGDHLALMSDANDWQVHSAVELHHDQFTPEDEDWIAQVLVDDGFREIRSLDILE